MEHRTQMTLELSREDRTAPLSPCFRHRHGCRCGSQAGRTRSERGRTTNPPRCDGSVPQHIAELAFEGPAARAINTLPPRSIGRAGAPRATGQVRYAAALLPSARMACGCRRMKARPGGRLPGGNRNQREQMLEVAVHARMRAQCTLCHRVQQRDPSGRLRHVAQAIARDGIIGRGHDHSRMCPPPLP